MATGSKDEEDEELWVCVCGDGEAVTFDVSKIADYSGYFSAMIRCEMRETEEKQISLQLISSETLVRLLKLFNVHEHPIQTEAEAEVMFDGDLSLDNIEEFLNAADYLDIPCVYPRCCDILIMLLPSLCSGLTMIWRVWEIARYYSLQVLKSEMYAYLAMRLSQYTATDYFFIRELPLDLLAGILSSSDIDVSSELEVMKLIKDWIMYCPDIRMKHLDRLMKTIHIPSMLHCEINEIKLILSDLDGFDHDLIRTYSSYLSNPHQFFATRQDQTEVRNGQEVVILFSGVYESRLNPLSSLQTGRGRPRNASSLPLCYQTIDVIRRQCLYASPAQHKTNSPTLKSCAHASRKGKAKAKTRHLECSPDSSISESGLCPKAMTKIKSPGTLTEFGLCVHENFVYMAGGQHKPQADAYPRRGVYRFDCHLGEWADVAPMTVQRCLFYLCSAWGRVYAVGGASLHGILRQVEYYEPAEDKWCDGPDLPHELHEHAGCVYDKKIYVCGGHNDTEHSDKLLVLDGPAGKWRPLAPMLQARSYHAMAIAGSQIYVFGGCCQIGEDIKDLYCVDQYNPLTNTWTQLFNLNVPINESLPIPVDDEILFVGSYSFEMKESLHQTVSVNVHTHRWKVAPLEFAVGKKMVGYKGLKLRVKNRLVK